ncbi:Endonuclease/exonuclease/phosphatase [Russula compacta]|nr:Endonuclease/exonuclease/phosphatase [Russula compacta]
MRHLSVKARVKQFFRFFPSSSLSTLTPIGRHTMADAVVPIRARWYSPPGQWEYVPQTPYDINARYEAKSLPTSLTLLTWNIDFMERNVTQRLTAALDYLQFHAFPNYDGGQPPPCLILLQEIHISTFDTLLAHPWVQAWFMVVPGSPADWPEDARYGTVTLVARSAPLVAAGCVYFESWMQRNALVTDVGVGGGEPHLRVLRVVNTHLESLPMGTQMRVAQMGVIANLLKKERTLGGIVCGDMNPIAPSDETLAEQNGLSDAWEHRRDKEEDGTTWGYQPKCKFPPRRFDKILYTENDAIDIKDVRRMAVGLTMPGGQWVSDHCGLICQVEVHQTTSQDT